MFSMRIVSGKLSKVQLAGLSMTMKEPDEIEELPPGVEEPPLGSTHLLSFLRSFATRALGMLWLSIQTLKHIRSAITVETSPVQAPHLLSKKSV